MPRHGYLFWTFFLGLAASLALACGGNPGNKTPGMPGIPPDSNPQHQIVSLSVSPSSADASQVQFLATGTYSSPPVTVGPLQANWVVIQPSGGQATEVSINANGFAQCAAGASGIYSVGAWVTLFPGPPAGLCNVVSPFGNPCGDSVLGTAQLTCP
jgi:hypothetical protein